MTTDFKLRFQGVVDGQYAMLPMGFKDVFRVIDAQVTDVLEFPEDGQLQVLESELGDFIKALGDLKSAVAFANAEDAREVQRELSAEEQAAKKQGLQDFEISQRIEAQSLDRF